MKKILFSSLFIFIFAASFGQGLLDNSTQTLNTSEKTFPGFNLGIGGGLDYGGFGARFTVVASQRFEVFGALGYNLLGAGFNGGVDFRLAPKSHICPFIGAMYGYNAVIKITGASQFNQTYYGPSFTFGVEFWSKSKPNFFNLELIVPIRSAEFHSDYDDLKNNPNIEIKSEMIPVAISIGYHFGL